MEWKTTALVFPGQGSQIVGMGKDLVEAFPAARDTYERADEVLGFRLSALCFDGPEADLNDTINTQPALYTCGIATLRALEAALPDAQPLCAAGHSLGEFTALAAAGALSFEDGLRLVRERGRLMKLAGEHQPGAMAALLGLDAPQVRELCAQVRTQTGGTLVMANDNCPGQVVISGDDTTIEAGIEAARAAGAKRAVKLAVSIAAHSPLMQTASEAFRQVLQQTSFQAPRMPVYGNVEAAPLANADVIRHELDLQLTQSVRWTESVQAMAAAGVARVVELGPKDVLVGLVKRIDRAINGVSLNSAVALQAFIESAGSA